MKFTDFSSVENQAKPLPCNWMHNHALAVYIDKSISSIGILLFWEQANNNILNTIPIGIASY